MSEPTILRVEAIRCIDAAHAHISAFFWMFIVMLIVAVSRVAPATKGFPRFTSYFNEWMFVYFTLLGILMSLTTAMALVLSYDCGGNSRLKWLPDSFVPLAAALFGVLGFEALFRKFTIGFGEAQFDVASTLQSILDQAVPATLKRG